MREVYQKRRSAIALSLVLQLSLHCMHATAFLIVIAFGMLIGERMESVRRVREERRKDGLYRRL